MPMTCVSTVSYRRCECGCDRLLAFPVTVAPPDPSFVVPAVPTPTPETEEPAESEAGTPDCPTCGEAEGDCSCSVCSDCEERAESVCSLCGQCDDCCSMDGDCFDCRSCSRRRTISHYCSNCERCDRCCECCSCDNCGERVSVDDYCSSCDRCTSCECHCEEEEDGEGMHVRELEGTGKFHTASRSQRTRNPSRRYCSVEVEVAKLGDRELGEAVREVCRRWGASVGEDGSLPSTGFEIGTAPASGDLFLNQVAELGAALREAGAAVTTECGLHVHIDARDFSFWEVRRLIRVYAKIEEALFQVVPRSRRDNSYCHRCGDTLLGRLESGFDPKKCKDKVISSVYGRGGDRYFPDKRKERRPHERYSALNLHSWYYRGTVECRLFGGTTDAQKIGNWGLLWAGLLDWVYSHSEKDVDSLRSLSPWKSLLSLAPSASVRDWLEGRRQRFAGINNSVAEEGD